MVLDALKYTGGRSKVFETEVTARRAMNYAAALDDGNPRYFDDTRPGGIIAPPMLAVALTWPISGRFAEFWGDSGFPYEVLRRQVHYSERIEWARPLAPGDRLSISGVVRAIEAHRAGTHLVLEYTAVDGAGGVVFVERIGGLLRGVRCENGAAPEAWEGGLFAGCAPVWESELPVDALAAHRYDAGADIHFPIHTSPAFAGAVGLPGIIYHGTATLSLAVRELVNREAGGAPELVRAAGCMFTSMVRPGTAIRVRLLGGEQTDAGMRYHFDVVNCEGKPAVSGGFLEIGPPAGRAGRDNG